MRRRWVYFVAVWAARFYRARLVVGDFFHGPPRPWRSRRARRSRLLLGSEATDRASQRANRMRWNKTTRVSVQAELDGIAALPLVPEPSYPERGNA